MDKKTKFYRFKIIEPFLKKEKKLKDIEKEKNISYSTLKRWVSAYKKDGFLGLEKKKREDKNIFRKIDNKTFNEIKNSYISSEEKSITKLYRKFSNELKISYATFYRIVNNIDDFFNDSKTKYIEKIKKTNECYLILDISLYIFIKDQNSNKRIPRLLLILDVATLEIIDFIISFEKANFYFILSFIRNSLLKVSINNSKLILPKEILVSSNEINDSQYLKDIYQSTKIKIIEHYTDNLEIHKFINFLKNDLQIFYKYHNLEVTLSEIKKFLTIYLYFYKPKYSFSLNYRLIDNLEYIRKLDVFLEKSTRKVYNSRIRFKNNIYFNKNLNFENGTNIILRSSPNISDIIYLYDSIHDNYLFSAFKNKKSMG